MSTFDYVDGVSIQPKYKWELMTVSQLPAGSCQSKWSLVCPSKWASTFSHSFSEGWWRRMVVVASTYTDKWAYRQIGATHPQVAFRFYEKCRTLFINYCDKIRHIGCVWTVVLKRGYISSIVYSMFNYDTEKSVCQASLKLQEDLVNWLNQMKFLRLTVLEQRQRGRQ